MFGFIKAPLTVSVATLFARLFTKSVLLALGSLVVRMNTTDTEL